MNFGKKYNTNQNPLIHAGWINKIFFWWLKDLILYGRTHEFAANDLYDTIPGDLSEPLRNCLETAWKNETNKARAKKRKPSLWKAFIIAYYWDFVKFSSFSIGFSILLTIGPYLLELMMSYFRPTSTLSPKWAYMNATIFVFLMILRTVFFTHGFFHLTRLGMRARIACTSLIYKKMIRLSASASHGSGRSIISLLTVDLTKFETFFTFLLYVVIAPIQLLVTIYLIHQYVGHRATLVSVAFMIFLTISVQVFYNTVFFKLRAKQFAKTDMRISLIGEIVSGIRAVKMYVWEKCFEEFVYAVRRREIRYYLRISYVTSAVWAVASFGHRLCTFLAVLVYVPQYGMITADKILPVAQHFNNLRQSIILLPFFGIRRISDMRVSMKRIEDFLLLEEVDFNVKQILGVATNKMISIQKVTASWNDHSRVLKDIDLNFVPKNLYAIVGAVGSGKSSLLKLILGEIRLLSGRVSIYGRISYASQEPWLFPASIKSNILFGEPFDKKRYEKVVSACALFEDFTQLPYGDETLVRDRGMNLSGGQCARVNLARAVYRDADIYLFDNPLSAVDTRVAKKLMDECINDLLKDKTRILVTHNMALLQGVDEIILLKLGTVEFRGNVGKFKKTDHYLKYLLSDDPEMATKTIALENDLRKSKLNTNNSIIMIKSSNTKKEPQEIEEMMAKGAVKMSVYYRYIKAGGFNHVLLLILLNMVFVATVTSFDYGLVAWIQGANLTSENELSNNAKTVSGNVFDFNTSYHNNFSLLLSGLIILTLFASVMINVSFNRFVLCASKNIHNDMLRSLMKTTLRFFEVNPAGEFEYTSWSLTMYLAHSTTLLEKVGDLNLSVLGRILNRFSEDTRITDDILPQALSEAIQSIFLALALLLSAVVVNWWIIIPSGISIFFYYLIGRMYLTTIPKMTRLVGTAKSHVLSFVASSLDGLTTIRACKAENIVSKGFDSRQDQHTAASFLTLALLPANSLWVELSNLGLLATIVYACIILKNDNTPDGYVGLALMQIMNLTVIMSNMLVRLVQALSFMPNVERMLQFVDLEPEDSVQSKRHIEFPISWPNNGEIKFEKLYLRYSVDSDPVLWNLNFTVLPGSKVGIVGRTGAGKSSLISALFRLAIIEGSLLIDGVDTKDVELSILRSKISIIPQEPFLINATLRKNLDPLSEFEDALLWSALEDVELRKTFDTLDSTIDCGGSNLSLGQRQLICLARAILKRNKVLILDEATANIDSVTDALIQKTIRNKFNKCTVLTISHRLDTVMDSDKILVMDNGRAVEYDQPFLLLRNENSHFFKMFQQTDNATANQLKAIAKVVKPDVF